MTKLGHFAIILVLAATVLLHAPISRAAQSAGHPPRILKFSGVPMAQALQIKKQFPYVFERPVLLSEVDEVVRFLMATHVFSNIEVVERENTQGFRELVLVAAVLRHIQKIEIHGNKTLSTDEIQNILGISAGQPFERKNLVNAADDLREAYQKRGFHNTKVEIDFDLPNENEVAITIAVDEGDALKLGEVSIDSPNKDLSTRLERIGKPYRGQVLTEDKLLEFNKEVEDYLLSHRYLTARLSTPSMSYDRSRSIAKLSYTIENPYRYEFRFTGNDYFSDGSLITDLESEKLAGATSSPAPDMAERVRRMYQAAGFANVEVEYKESQNESRRLIDFKILENPRVKIGAIEISGNISRPQEYYVNFINTSSTASDLLGDGYYNRKDIDDGTKHLITELQNQGYLRAKIQSQRAEFSKDKKSVAIYLNLDEGPLTQIRQIRIDGAEAIPKAQLLDTLKIKSGAALSLKDLEDSIQALKDYYHSRGYLEMKILNENERNQIVSYNDTNTQATIDFKIFEGPKVTVGSIVLEGNTFTKDYVISREIAFKKGDILTPDNMNESVYRLRNLGLFSGVTIRTLEEGTGIGERTVVVQITEKDPGLFKLGFGINNERDLTFRGYLGIAYSNIAGTGRGISFRVDPKYSTDPHVSYIENRETLSYLEPHIFGESNTRGRINLVREEDYYGQPPPPYSSNSVLILQQNNLGLLLERDLTHNIKLTYTAYSFSNQLEFDRATRATVLTQNIAKIGPLTEFDYRDNQFNPSRGSYSFVDFNYSDPLLGSSRDDTQEIKFVKTNVSSTLYNHVSERHKLVWVNGFRAGYMSNIGTDKFSGVPSQEDFFLGGRSTIRGFDGSVYDRIPNLYDLKKGNITQFDMTSDSYYYLVKTELRYPLWKNFPLGELGGTIFYDGGAVLLSQMSLPDPYRDSVGIGIRVETPIGPLNLEVGYKLERRLLAVADPSHGVPTTVYEQPFAFHFSIGSF